MAGNIFGNQFAYHLQTARIEIQLLMIWHLRQFFAFDFHITDGKGIAGKINVQVLRLSGKLFFWFEQIENQACVELLSNQVNVIQRRSGRFRRLFFRNPFDCLFDCFKQYFRRQLQLDEIVHDLIGNGFFDEVKFLVTGQYNEQRKFTTFFPAFSGQFQTAHNRHFDVRDNDFRRSGRAVWRGSDNADIVVFPVYHGLDAGLYEGLIIGDNQFYHSYLPPWKAIKWIWSWIFLFRFEWKGRIGFQIHTAGVCGRCWRRFP